MPIFTFLSFIM